MHKGTVGLIENQPPDFAASGLNPDCQGDLWLSRCYSTCTALGVMIIKRKPSLFGNKIGINDTTNGETAQMSYTQQRESTGDMYALSPQWDTLITPTQHRCRFSQLCFSSL